MAVKRKIETKLTIIEWKDDETVFYRQEMKLKPDNWRIEYYALELSEFGDTNTHANKKTEETCLKQREREEIGVCVYLNHIRICEQSK